MRARWGAAVVALALLGAGCNDDGEDVAETGEGPTTTSTSTTAPATSSTDGSSTTTSAPTGGLEQPALWPAPDVVFNDPVAAATDFLELVIGAGEAGEFRQGDARSGEVDVVFRGEGGDRELVRSTLLLRQLGEQDGWFVIGAANPNARITAPETGATVPAGPLTVEGSARGFEANVVVSAHQAGVAGPPIAQSITSGGAFEQPEPFTTTVDLSGVAPGTVVTLLVRGGVGLETDPGDFGAIPVVVAP